MSRCIFCLIVAGEVPTQEISRTERTLAIRDVDPVAPSHLLVLPLAHLENLSVAMGSDPTLGAEILAHCAALANAEGLADGYRVVINTGRNGGQTVPHLHAHVLGGRPFNWPPG